MKKKKAALRTAAVARCQVGLDGVYVALKSVTLSTKLPFAAVVIAGGPHVCRRAWPQRRAPVPLPQALPGAFLPALTGPLEAKGHPTPQRDQGLPRRSSRPQGQPRPLEAKGAAPARPTPTGPGPRHTT